MTIHPLTRPLTRAAEAGGALRALLLAAEDERTSEADRVKLRRLFDGIAELCAGTAWDGPWEGRNVARTAQALAAAVESLRPAAPQVYAKVNGLHEVAADDDVDESLLGILRRAFQQAAPTTRLVYSQGRWLLEIQPDRHVALIQALFRELLHVDVDVVRVGQVGGDLPDSVGER